MYPRVEHPKGVNSEGRGIQLGQEFNNLDYDGFGSSPGESSHSASCSNDYGAYFCEEQLSWLPDTTQFLDTPYTVISEVSSTGADAVGSCVNSHARDNAADQLFGYEFLQPSQALESSGYTHFESSPFNSATLSTEQFAPVATKIASPLASVSTQASPILTYEPWQDGQAEVYSPMYQEPSNRTTPELSIGQSPSATVTQPGTPTNQVEPRHRCRQCGKVFDKSNDLKRHEATHFPDLGQRFTCKCGYRNKRKDNYKRHVLTCQKLELDDSFRCACDLLDTNKDNHLRHIRNCKAAFHGNAGRPARVAAR